MPFVKTVSRRKTGVAAAILLFAVLIDDEGWRGGLGRAGGLAGFRLARKPFLRWNNRELHPRWLLSSGSASGNVAEPRQASRAALTLTGRREQERLLSGL
jgi:hypothetical protein